MRTRRWLLLLLSLAVIMAVGDVASAVPRWDGPAPREPGAASRRAPNHAPRLVRDVEVSAHVGVPASVLLPVVDREGDAVDVSVAGPPGLSVARTADGWRLHWEPRTTGPGWALLTLTDQHGAGGVGRVWLRATNPPTADTLLGMGDSVASGHGLQRRDYLQGDGCWRAEGEAYPALVHDALVERGDLGAGGDVHLVACSGATLADLLSDPVTGGPDDVGEGDDQMTQVEWAVAANPELITITAGANTLGFTDAWNLLEGDGTIATAELDRRLEEVERDLERVLRRLVDHTDSTIVVTNYYNPAARNPQGIDGCEGDCFRRRSDEVVDGLHRSFASVLADIDSDRIVLVDLIDAFADHGAPNGLGPDGFRAGGFGWIRDLVGAPFEGVHPYCAIGHDDDGSWVNYVDCVHPDGRGHHEIARLVLAALR